MTLGSKNLGRRGSSKISSQEMLQELSLYA